MTVNDPTLNDKIVNMVLYNQPAAPTDGTPSMFNLQPNMIAVRYTCDNNAESPSYEVVVTISGYQYQMLAPYIAGTKVGKDIVATSPTEYVTNDAAPFCSAS